MSGKYLHLELTSGIWEQNNKYTKIAKPAAQVCSEGYHDLKLKQNKKTKFVIYISV